MKSYRILKIAYWMFLVFAYGFGIVVQGVFAGLIPLIMGGDPVTLINGVGLPARAVGAISLFVSAPIAFIMFHAFASGIKLLLDIHARLDRVSSSTG